MTTHSPPSNGSGPGTPTGGSNSANGFGPGDWFGGGPQNSGGNGRSRTTNRTRSREYHFHVHDGSGRNGQQGPRGGGDQGGQAFFGRGNGARHGGHSPLADPEFFSNADIRNYCENGRGLFLQFAFELANAAEVLNAVLKEVPDPEGRAFGSRMRARRVSRKLKKAADDARDTAKNMAATYAAFQREFDPELAPYRGRQRHTGRRFDFNS
ncbi:plasmid transfer protein TraA [Streptomyces sp. NPDC059015]|uniref:plasmid transfer protein TraA n=1 Tax=unclassified Streptomyces TaxID=2593676 RepID=UPI0036BB727D